MTMNHNLVIIGITNGLQIFIKKSDSKFINLEIELLTMEEYLTDGDSK